MDDKFWDFMLATLDAEKSMLLTKMPQMNFEEKNLLLYRYMSKLLLVESAAEIRIAELLSWKEFPFTLSKTDKTYDLFPMRTRYTVIQICAFLCVISTFYERNGYSWCISLLPRSKKKKKKKRKKIKKRRRILSKQCLNTDQWHVLMVMRPIPNIIKTATLLLVKIRHLRAFYGLDVWL